MRRLRPKPPDEATVERIVEIFRAWYKKQKGREPNGGKGGGGASARWDPMGASN